MLTTHDQMVISHFTESRAYFCSTSIALVKKNEKTLTLLRDDFLKTFELSAEMNKTRLIAIKLIFKIVFTFLPFYQPNFQTESISFHVMQHEKHRLST